MKCILFAGIALCALPLQAKEEEGRPKCFNVRGHLEEHRQTEGCKPPHKSCFRGVLEGDHGFHATTYFKADSGVPGPETSPGSTAYSGAFEYTTARGTIEARETGVNAPADPEQLAVTAYQKITTGTGVFAGATGHFFVSGFVTDAGVVTEVTGRVCW
ncbi:hypothetical protein LVJ94_29030 [Pendulispora rubella]|uniref:Uncharacterized protein n=1 Tax=Pendulispora rubella TaxID=2741070 RepID=A0ABZ2KR16_9BACT